MSVPSETQSPISAGQLTWRDLWIGALFFGCLATIFLITPILRIGDSIYSPVDVGMIFPLTQTQAWRPENPRQKDVYDMLEPWELYDRDLVRQGELPLWNPYNADGTPQLANYQSAVFSVFSLPLYLLPVRVALIVMAFLKLWVAGTLTYLFLCSIGLRRLPALTGGLAYMFSGYMTLWLNWANPGAAALIPGCLLFIDLIISQLAARRSAVWAMLGLFVCQVLGLLAGHPETTFFGVLLSAAYAAFRLYGLARQLSFRRAVVAGGILLGVELLAAGAAAIQIIPFLEFLINGSTDMRGPVAQLLLPPFLLPSLAYPLLLGSPADPRTIEVVSLIPFGFIEQNQSYIGLACVCLALLGIVLANHRKTARRYLFFAGVIAVWVIYVPDILGLRPLINALPGMMNIASLRSAPVLLLALATCAACTLDGLLDKAHNLRTALAVVALGGGLLIVAAWSGVNLVVQSAALVKNLPIAAIVSHTQTISGHFQLTTLLVGAAILLAAWSCLSQSRAVRSALGVGLLAIVYLQSGWLFRDFNPTIPQALFYPETDAIRTLKAQISDGGQVLLRQGTLLLPNSNLPFRLPTTSLYGGGIEPRYYYQLKVSLFGNNAPLNDAEHFDETSLRLFGVQAIATDDVQHLDQYASNPAYRVLARQPSYALLRYLNALPAFHVTYNALVAASDQQVLSLLKAPGFDPTSQVILSAPADLSSLTAPVGQVSSSAETLRVLADEPTRTVIDLSNHSQPGFLVLDKTFYPGWKASVDGLPAPVYRANYAFSAIPLGQTASRVEFYYDPDSFKLGVAISASSLALLLLWLYRRSHSLMN